MVVPMFLIGQTSIPLLDNNKDDIYFFNICACKYKHWGSVARHLKFKRDVKPKFHCTIYSKYFKQRINLKIHMVRIHSCIMYFFYCIIVSEVNNLLVYYN